MFQVRTKTHNNELEQKIMRISDQGEKSIEFRLGEKISRVSNQSLKDNFFHPDCKLKMRGKFGTKAVYRENIDQDGLVTENVVSVSNEGVSIGNWLKIDVPSEMFQHPDYYKFIKIDKNGEVFVHGWGYEN